jgi:hypothetical protein
LRCGCAPRALGRRLELSGSCDTKGIPTGANLITTVACRSRPLGGARPRQRVGHPNSKPLTVGPKGPRLSTPTPRPNRRSRLVEKVTIPLTQGRSNGLYMAAARTRKGAPPSSRVANWARHNARMALPTPPDEDVRRLLETVWTEVESAEHWPRYEVVDRRLYVEHELDIDAVLARTPPDLLVGGVGHGDAPPSPDDQLRLTIVGAAACLGSEATVHAFMRAVEVSARTEAKHPRDVQQANVSADQVIVGASDGAHAALMRRRLCSRGVSASCLIMSRGYGLVPCTTGDGPYNPTGVFDATET